MLFASVIKSASLLLVQWCLLLSTSFFVSDVAAWLTLIMSRLPISSILAATIR